VLIRGRFTVDVAGMFTVDAGSKALAAEVPAPIAKVLGHAAFRALGPSEEHLPFAVDAGEETAPTRGSVLYLVPKHVRSARTITHRRDIVGTYASLLVLTWLAALD